MTRARSPISTFRFFGGRSSVGLILAGVDEGPNWGGAIGLCIRKGAEAPEDTVCGAVGAGWEDNLETAVGLTVTEELFPLS